MTPQPPEKNEEDFKNIPLSERKFSDHPQKKGFMWLAVAFFFLFVVTGGFLLVLLLKMFPINN